MSVNNIDLLNYIYQNAKISGQNISQLIPKVENLTLQQTLINQLTEYQKISSKATELLNKLNINPKEDVLEKFGNKAEIMFNTIGNNSTSHIAELMINDSQEGAIDMIKKIRECKDSQPVVRELGENLIKTEEKNAVELKRFL